MVITIDTDKIKSATEDVARKAIESGKEMINKNISSLSKLREELKSKLNAN